MTIVDRLMVLGEFVLVTLDLLAKSFLGMLKSVPVFVFWAIVLLFCTGEFPSSQVLSELNPSDVAHWTWLLIVFLFAFEFARLFVGDGVVITQWRKSFSALWQSFKFKKSAEASAEVLTVVSTKE
jgi:hypothetical protein